MTWRFACARSQSHARYSTDQSCIVEHDIETTVFLDCAVDGRFDICFAGYVSMLKHGIPTCCRDFSDYLLPALRIEIGGHNRRAFRREAQGCAAPIPLAAPVITATLPSSLPI